MNCEVRQHLLITAMPIAAISQEPILKADFVTHSIVSATFGGLLLAFRKCTMDEGMRAVGSFGFASGVDSFPIALVRKKQVHSNS